MNALDKAAKLFELAGIYAEDGGIQEAIDRATEGIAVLKAERKRRQDLMHVGGIPSAPRTRLPINKLVTACVTGKRGR